MVGENPGTQSEADSCEELFTAAFVMTVLYSDLTGGKWNLKQSEFSFQILLDVHAGFIPGYLPPASFHGFHSLQK